MEPIVSDLRIAWAELIVEAAMASAGVNFMARHANAITNCIDSFQVVPGLQSVARARTPSASMILRAAYVVGESANTATTYGYDMVTFMQESKVTLCRIEAA